mgnify:FL=1
MSDSEARGRDRPAMDRRLVAAGGVVLAASLGAELFIPHHGAFGIDGRFGFYAWFSFLAAAVLAAGASLVGAALRRPAGYYGR